MTRTTPETDWTVVNGENLDPEFLSPEEPDQSAGDEFTYDEPDSKIGPKRPRSTKAKHYEKKIGNMLSGLFRIAVARPATVADGAAIMMHGPDLAEKAGDLAAHNATFARAIDMITEGSENPYFNLLAAATPLVVQVLRNHEQPVPSTVVRELRIPFTKKTFKLRWKFKLTMPPMVRNLSHEPDALNHYVFTNEKVAAMIKREGINVAWRVDR